MMAEIVGNTTAPSNDKLSASVNLCITLLGIKTPIVSEERELIGEFDQDDNVNNTHSNEEANEKQRLLRNSTQNHKTTRINPLKPIMATLNKTIWPLLSFGIVILTIYDLFVYLDCFWGRTEDVLFLVIHITYMTQLVSVPFVCLWIWLGLRIKPSSMPAVIFLKEYLLRIIRVRQGSKTEMVKFMLILSWPVINLLQTIFVFVTIEFKESSTRVYLLIIRSALIFCYIQHGCLAFMELQLRKAFSKRFTELAKELKVESEDESKTKICNIYFDYKKFRDFVGYWITFSLADAAVGTAALVLWNYGYYTSGFGQSQFDHPMLMFSIMIWNQKLMFISLPLIVFGGFNVDYLWDDFKEEVAFQLSGTAAVGQKLHHLLRHMDELNRPPQWVVSTLIFSLLGFYFGMTLNNQDFVYWKGPDCYNSTIKWIDIN